MCIFNVLLNSMQSLDKNSHFKALILCINIENLLQSAAIMIWTSNLWKAWILFKCFTLGSLVNTEFQRKSQTVIIN